MSDEMNLVDWDAYAKCYDALLELTPYQDMFRTIVTIVSAREHGTVLDAACGTGNLAHYLEAAGVSVGTLVGVDASRTMAYRALDKYAPFCGTVQIGDLCEPLPFESDTFDCIVSVNTLYTLSDPNRTLASFARVLRPGGSLIVVNPKQGYENGLILREHCNSEKPEEYWMHVHRSSEHEVRMIREALGVTDVSDQFITVADCNRRIAHTVAYHFLDERSLRGLIEHAGLTVTYLSYVYAGQAIIVTATK